MHTRCSRQRYTKGDTYLESVSQSVFCVQSIKIANQTTEEHEIYGLHNYAYYAGKFPKFHNQKGTDRLMMATAKRSEENYPIFSRASSTSPMKAQKLARPTNKKAVPAQHLIISTQMRPTNDVQQAHANVEYRPLNRYNSQMTYLK